MMQIREFVLTSVTILKAPWMYTVELTPVENPAISSTYCSRKANSGICGITAEINVDDQPQVAKVYTV